MNAQAIAPPKEAAFRRLRLWNLVAGVFHLAQAVVMVVISNSAGLAVTTMYSKYTGGKPEPLLKTIANPRIGIMVSLFLFMSALAHFAISTPGGYRWYVRNLKQHINYARWIEYAFSASWMIVLIAMITGMSDLSSLILIGFLNMTMLLFGMLMERFNKANDKLDWLPFYFGCIGWIVPWVTIVLFIAGANGTGGGKVPGFVYGIMASLFVFFSVFALNMVLQYRRVGKWRDYLYGEKVYIVLSLTAKALLAWQVFSAVLRG